MICGDYPSIDAAKVESMSVDELRGVYENCEQFSCSFVAKEGQNDEDPMSFCRIDLETMKAFYSKTILSVDDNEAREGVQHERRQDFVCAFCDAVGEGLAETPSLDFLLAATRGLIMLILMPDVDLSTESFEGIVL